MNNSVPGGMFWRRATNRLRRELGMYAKRSYAQCGEDLIVRFAFDAMGIAAPGYLDIGAHHPHFLSNTQLFYRAGSRGVNVEPDPELFRHFLRYRKADVNLNLGVGPSAADLELFVMSSRTLNTFSPVEAAEYERRGFKILHRLNIPVITVRELINRHCSHPPQFVSLDVEGLDYAILETFDFSRHRPTIFCVETLSFSTEGEGEKAHEIDALFERNGYLHYADTHINTIYVEQSQWRRSRR
jgi:FkbM family methyltransferase